MQRRFASVAFAMFCALAVGACGHEAPPPAQVAAIETCPDSEETGCQNGKPLCAFDDGRACQMCRCTQYSLLPSDQAGSIAVVGPYGLVARPIPR